MTRIYDLIYNSGLLYERMGSDLDKLGGVLRCKVCRHELPITPGNGDTARYLQTGWPRHCDQGMVWVTQKELDVESKKP